MKNENLYFSLRLLLKATKQNSETRFAHREELAKNSVAALPILNNFTRVTHALIVSECLVNLRKVLEFA